jgi:hypothetical protein
MRVPEVTELFRQLPPGLGPVGENHDLSLLPATRVLPDRLGRRNGKNLQTVPETLIDLTQQPKFDARRPER